MKVAYVRATKLLSEADQRAALAGGKFRDWYVDEKPKRGEPGRYWLGKAIHACRPGSDDELWVSHASVIADSLPAALEVLAQITERGAVLVVASTGKRYAWHPDAAPALELALSIEREVRQAVAKKGGEAAAKAAADRRRAAAGKLAEAKRLWLDQSIPASEVYARTGMTRHELHKQFGPSGRPRFGKVRKDG